MTQTRVYVATVVVKIFPQIYSEILNDVYSATEHLASTKVKRYSINCLVRRHTVCQRW